MYINPIIRSVIPPNIVDIFPYFLFKMFPRFSPIYVNVRLVIEKIPADNIYLFVIIGRPIPVVRLSMLTDKPNNK